MLELKKDAELKDFQQYVVDLEFERGFSGRPITEKCLMLGEEIGELFKSIRKAEGLTIDPNSKFGPISDELADVLIYICSIANHYNIDLKDAFLKKEEINKQRKWVKA